ncbi:UDP-glucose 4-epimerase GalE [Polynucleobacter sp. AP-Sanab-80-C2]|uniref:UDP-glucose 4-epimerase GalE n=1 Tax=Polynucleobacter sp. AP-Sanab-80-C2 TaxID=3108274 RepID=UPI002B224734|nr:UDP-glucose 4-epimerase GalE [Polynucleobacter sp. AP-Sanab-80-C2]MEA9598573.1 UDP-glucose 4-epimerase GalE [Polynucleobacter sp. AP-Sanab-80-C2]
MNILLTGGLGYIGSHVAVVLTEAGHQVTILDNLCNCKIEVLDRLEKILGRAPAFFKGDVRDQALVESILKEKQINSVIHFAGLKAVGESVQEPLMYYDNNVGGTISLLKAMKNCEIKTIVFSSSASVYGIPVYLPYDEEHPTRPQSPYGKSKLQVEEILKDLSDSDPEWKVVALRYFNPVGAHDSGLIGEDPAGVPNNLIPYVAQVAIGKLEKLKIFGDDYDTPNGTGVRDYIHVMDLAEGHNSALLYVSENTGFSVFNLGTGNGYSVYEVVDAFTSASSRKIPYEIVDRRGGDIASYYANAQKAKKFLGWSAKRGLLQMCIDAWKWAVLH